MMIAMVTGMYDLSKSYILHKNAEYLYQYQKHRTYVPNNQMNDI